MNEDPPRLRRRLLCLSSIQADTHGTGVRLPGAPVKARIGGMSLQPGFVLHNRYRIESRLGKGGMGAVYLAVDQTLGIQVAVKENLNPNPESERQFRREAGLLASLRHPNLPRVTDHFILEGHQYLVMDYVEGEDLHTRCARQAPTVVEVLTWGDAICNALAYLHSLQPPVIHRDIKPANIKLQRDGSPVLVDFGIAKLADQSQTSTGARGLTPGFSPPEQYGGTRTDARSDQYSLAATLYALLTGGPPMDSIERMLNKAEVKPLRGLNPSVPAHVEQALLKAMSLERDDRYPDITAFRGALQGEPEAATVRVPEAVATTAARTPVARSKRGFWLALAIGGGGLAILGIGGWIGWGVLRNLLPTAVSPTVPVVALIPTETPTFTPTPVPPTETPSPTLPPSATPAPSVTPSETPELLGGGGRIAFVSDRGEGGQLQIFTMNPDGSDVRQLTFGPGDKTQPRWSPDGSRLLYVAADPGHGLDLWVINADGTGPANLIQSPGDDTDPAWSPLGGRIAFTSTRINSLEQVFVADISCLPAPDSCSLGPQHNLSAGFAVEYSPAWSPDGLRLAVVVSINGAPGRIYFRSLAGGEPTQFDRGDRLIGADTLDWSPDGTYLAFTWRQPTMNEVYLVPVDHPTQTTRLTTSLGNKEPAFSPDGRYIVFTSTRDQNPEIYLMNAAGAGEVNLTGYRGQDMQPDWQPRPGP